MLSLTQIPLPSESKTDGRTSAAEEDRLSGVKKSISTSENKLRQLDLGGKSAYLTQTSKGETWFSKSQNTTGLRDLTIPCRSEEYEMDATMSRKLPGF